MFEFTIRGYVGQSTYACELGWTFMLHFQAGEEILSVSESYGFVVLQKCFHNDRKS